MADLAWNSKYLLGIPIIDSQHKNLVGLINLLSKNKDSTDAEFVKKVFSTLTEYVETHFSLEENLLEMFAIPDFIKHKKQHEQFIEKLSTWKNMHGKQKTGVPQEVLDFLGDWLIGHILIHDKAYRTYIHEQTKS